jgi:hypothetical protein
MKKSILEIYALAVCFFNVACFVIVLGFAAWNVVEIAIPKFTISTYDYQHHRSDDAYRELLIITHNAPYAPPEGNALTAAREKALAEVLSGKRREALQDLIKDLLILSINVVVFAVHWRIAAHARRNVA